MCKLWDETIRSDIGLQYKQELAIADLENGDAEFGVDVSQRLKLLREYQKAWDNLEFTNDFFVDLERDNFVAPELQGGVFSQKCSDHSIAFIRIPSKIRGIPHSEWSIEDVGFQFTHYTFDPSQNLLVLFEPLSYVHTSIDCLPI